MNRFIHSGDLGDVIYALPTLKALGGGALHLCHVDGINTTFGMKADRVALIRPLLEAQPYIQEVRTSWPTGESVWNLNHFRRGDGLHNTYHPAQIARAFGVTFDAKPWLTAPSERVAAVLIARSPRYHNPHFPWRKVVETYGYHAAFIGLPSEHAAFVTEFGSVRHAHCATLYDVAKLIAGCSLFVGNQSAPLAIAHGLGKRVVVEVSPTRPTCIAPEERCIAGHDEWVQLPAI